MLYESIGHTVESSLLILPALRGRQPAGIESCLRISDIGSVINPAEFKPEIERVCRSLPVKRLGLFGSALTQDFAADSDVDVLVDKPFRNPIFDEVRKNRSQQN